jgi:hypothetical protein
MQQQRFAGGGRCAGVAGSRRDNDQGTVGRKREWVDSAFHRARDLPRQERLKMQLLAVRPRPALLAKTSYRALLLLSPLLIAFLGGCAAQKPFQFHANSITKISYDPKNCTELPDGTFRCKDVVFTVTSVEPVQAKKPVQPVQQKQQDKQQENPPVEALQAKK